MERISSLYGHWIVMKDDGMVRYHYGDQLGSVSAVADVSGSLAQQTAGRDSLSVPGCPL